MIHQPLQPFDKFLLVSTSDAPLFPGGKKEERGLKTLQSPVSDPSPLGPLSLGPSPLFSLSFGRLRSSLAGRLGWVPPDRVSPFVFVLWYKCGVLWEKR